MEIETVSEGKEKKRRETEDEKEEEKEKEGSPCKFRQLKVCHFLM